MMNRGLYFLIKMTQKALRKLHDRDLEDELKNSSVRLYKLFNRPSKTEGEHDWVVALPLPDRNVLMLKKEKSKNYFVCVGVLEDLHLPHDGIEYYQLPDDVRVLIVESVGPYEAVNCGNIEQAVESKNMWNPWTGSDFESKVWHAYINLQKEAIESQQFGLPASLNAQQEKDLLFVVNDDALDSDSIIVSKQRVSFDLSLSDSFDAENSQKDTLGRMKSFEEKRKHMIIELDDNFKGFQQSVERGIFYAPLDNEKSEEGDNRAGDTAEIEFVSAKLLKPAESLKTFYYDSDKKIPAFSCLAEYDASGKWRIAPDSIEPKNMMLFADFKREKYQLNVMECGLRRIVSLPIWQVLSGDRVSKLPLETHITWADNCHLNLDQKEAVRKAIGAQELCLIWGPPGTGKTEVIMEIARQECQLGHKTLIASQANLAVDNALARLHKSSDAWPLRVARTDYELKHDEDKKKVPMKDTKGHFFAKRLRTLIKEHNQESNVITSQLRRDLIKRLKKIENSEKRPDNDREILQLEKLYRRRINVVGATLMGTGKKGKNSILSETKIPKFDTVIVDEVSKALPTELFLPILLGGKVILVGDYRQLPPLLKLDSHDHKNFKKLTEKWAKKASVPKEEMDSAVKTTIFERLWKRHESEDAEKVRQMLTKQYRMHPEIQTLIQDFYKGSGGTLECGLTPEDLSKMRISSDGPFSNGHHAFWVNTTHESTEERDGTSYYNRQEIKIVGDILEQLSKDLNGKEVSVGVITFYGAQLQRLQEEFDKKYSEKFPSGLDFGTVDRFQGRENDVIICSLVRKNNNKDIGFAKTLNRINVAFSRARQLLCIVGNRSTFCENEEAGEHYYGIYKNCYYLSRREIQDGIPQTCRE